MTYFFANWILIVFMWGGIACLIFLLSKTGKLSKSTVLANVSLFRSGLKWMIAFVVLATTSLMNFLVQQHGEYGFLPQFIVNLLTGVVFIIAMLKLGRALQEEDQPKTTEKD